MDNYNTTDKPAVNINKNLFVFDIETIPDAEVVPNLLDCDKAKIDPHDPLALRQALLDYHLELTEGKNDFARQLFHRVVAVSFVEAKLQLSPESQEYYETLDLRSGGQEDSDEEEIIRGFFRFLEKRLPRLVSFNGRTFDLPVMRYRAMRYGIAVPWLYQSGDKWSSYLNRYSSNWHCDLLDVLSDYGASARVKMNEVCAVLGLPGKIGVDGSMVTSMFDAGRILEIRNYCETDVMNTYLIYLNYQYHRGDLSHEGFLLSIRSLATYLQQRISPEKPHFQEFLEAWKTSDTLNLYGLQK